MGTVNMRILKLLLISIVAVGNVYAQEIVHHPSMLSWDLRPAEEKIVFYQVFVSPVPNGQDLISPPSFVVNHPASSIVLSDFTAVLGDGPHFVKIFAVNIEGEIGGSSVEFGFIIDIIPPLPLPPPGVVANLRIELLPPVISFPPGPPPE